MDTKELFANLATISLIVILTGLQINYFHKKFIILTDSSSRTSTQETEESHEKTLKAQFKIVFGKVLLFCEIHSTKILYFVGFCVAVTNVSFWYNAISMSVMKSLLLRLSDVKMM